MHLLALPAFDDNYIWLLHNSQQAIVVDPGHAEPVIQALQQANLQLTAIFVTHHHGDHVGGVNALYTQYGTSHTQVYLPTSDGLSPEQFPAVDPAMLHMVQENSSFHCLGMPWHVYDVPGHTKGHIVFFSDQVTDQAPILFCGDTLFSAGCGRVFEGTYAQMAVSLNKLKQLPSTTQICAAHEYTLSNLRFALAVEPNNTAVQHHLALCQSLRAQQLPTLPSNLERELAINPFLRLDQPNVQQAAHQHHAAPTDAIDVFAALREWKNTF